MHSLAMDLTFACPCDCSATVAEDATRSPSDNFRAAGAKRSIRSVPCELILQCNLCALNKASLFAESLILHHCRNLRRPAWLYRWVVRNSPAEMPSNDLARPLHIPYAGIPRRSTRPKASRFAL